MKIIKAAIGFVLLSSVAFSAVAAEKPCADILVGSGLFNTDTMRHLVPEAPEKAARIVMTTTSACEAFKDLARTGVRKSKAIELMVDQQDTLRDAKLSETDLAVIFEINMAAYDSVK